MHKIISTRSKPIPVPQKKEAPFGHVDFWYDKDWLYKRGMQRHFLTDDTYWITRSI